MASLLRPLIFTRLKKIKERLAVAHQIRLSSLFFYSTSVKPFIRQKRRSKPKAREGRQVTEGKSRVKGSEEIPNVNEE